MELDDRKLAAAVWLMIFVGVLLWKPRLREQTLNLVRTALHRQLLLALLLVAVCVWAEALLLQSVGLWDSSHVVKTWLWTFSVGAFSVYGLGSAEDGMSAVKDMATKNFKFSVVFSFLVNLYPMPFWVEFLLVPVSVFFALIQATAEVQAKKNPQYASVATLAERLLLALGLIVALFAGHAIYDRFSDFWTLKTLKKFLVPIELSLLFIPLLYYFALLFAYERLWVRVNALCRKHHASRNLIWVLVLLKCNVRLRRLTVWSRHVFGLNLDSIKAVLDSFAFPRRFGIVSPPGGFRGLEWGTEPKSYMKLVGEGAECSDELTTYGHGEWAPLPLFGLPVALECYQFENGHLYSVSVFMDGKRAFDEGRYELQALYGPATFVNERIDLLRWRWSDPPVEIMLSYQESHDRVTVTVTNEGGSSVAQEATEIAHG